MNNQELFKHMKDQHGLTLLESEMLEIELICIKGIKSQLEKERDNAFNELIESIGIFNIKEWTTKEVTEYINDFRITSKNK